MKKGRLALFLVVVLLLILPACSRETMDWPEAGLSTVLPRPESAKGKVNLDLEDSFHADIEPASAADYSAYVAKCKEKGFTIDSNETSDSYDAYNSEGYYLHLLYFESQKGYSIMLDAPKVKGTFQWPTIGLALLLPQPGTNVGTISIDSASQFYAYIGETSKEDYQDYVTQCMEMGFTVDYDKGDTYFMAHNENGDSLYIDYQGFETMAISVYASDLLGESSEASSSGEESSQAPEPSANPSPSEEKTGEPESSASSDAGMTGIRQEFKEMMDSYEAFFEEYAEFMKKYKNSDDTAAMLSDYMDFMKRYVEAVEKLDEIDEEDLSAEEVLYYSEVMLRISQKISSVAEQE